MSLRGPLHGVASRGWAWIAASAAAPLLVAGCASSPAERLPGDAPAVVGIWQSVELPERLEGRAEVELIVADDGEWRSIFRGPADRVLFRGGGSWAQEDGDEFVFTSPALRGREAGRAEGRVFDGGDRLRVDTAEGSILYERVEVSGG